MNMIIKDNVDREVAEKTKSTAYLVIRKETFLQEFVHKSVHDDSN